MFSPLLLWILSDESYFSQVISTKISKVQQIVLVSWFALGVTKSCHTQVLVQVPACPLQIQMPELWEVSHILSWTRL